MNYTDAIKEIVRKYLSVWGNFCQIQPATVAELNLPTVTTPGTLQLPLPDLCKLTQPEAEAVLRQRATEMIEALRAERVGVFEVIVFIRELDLICLLLLVCYWGSIQDDIPLTKTDFLQIEGQAQAVLYGIPPDEDNVRGIIARLLKTGIQIGIISETSNPLTQIGYEDED